MMMTRAIYFSLLFILAPSSLIAQMTIEKQTLFGNEWLSEDQTYFKIKVGADGIYRIPVSKLSEVGFPIDQVQQEQIELFSFGKRIPIYISSLEEDGFIEFYGQKNRAELDRLLFEEPEQDMLNMRHSLYSDTSIYYLSWSEENNILQYQVIDEELTAQSIASDWYTQTDEIVNASNFFQKRHLQDLVTYSKYDVAEGFAANRSTAYSYNFQLRDFVPGVDSIRLKIRLASDRGNHHLQVKANNEIIIDDLNWPAYGIKEYNVTVPENLVTNGALALTINGILGIRDWFRVAQVSVSYPKAWQGLSSGLNTVQLDQVAQTGAVQLTSLSPDNTYLLLNPENQTRQVLVADATGALAKLTTDEEGQSWVLINEEEVKQVDNLELYQAASLDYDNVEYLILSHSSLLAGATAYKDYRSSIEGGAYRAELVMVDDLYDQFSYGVEGHPIAIRNYLNYLKDLGAPLDFTFLLGKGLEYQFIRNNANLRRQNLLPTFGSPGSDQLLLSTPGATAAITAVGRISAQSDEDINLYLESIKDYESRQRGERTYANHAWRKEAIHLVGGDVNEQPIFDAQMRFMELFAEENKWAASISKSTKLSSEPVPTSVSERIIDRVDDGVLIKAFLGHGSIIVTGFGLDDPTIFDHKGKYPLDFAFGCLTGNSYTTQVSVAERFVINPVGTGSIGYIASSGYGYPFTLGRFGGLFYEYLGNQHFNAGIGEILNLVIDSMDVFNGAPNISLSQQLKLEGDPAVRLFIEDAPDFVIDPSTVKINPGIISVEQDSISVDFTMANIGAWVEDSIEVLVKHRLPSDTTLSYVFQVKQTSSISSFNLSIPLAEGLLGIHQVDIEIDPQNQIAEFNAPEGENNNNIVDPNTQKEGIEFFVLPSGVQQVSPANYRVVNSENVVLKALSADIFTAQQSFNFELDTLASFQSSFKKTETIRSDNGLVEWTLDTDLESGKVYYWRVAETPTSSTTPINWQTSSFLYAPELEATWNQSHIDQYRAGELTRLKEEGVSNLEFNSVGLSVVVEAVARTGADPGNSRVLINNDRRQVGRSNSPLVGIMVFDSKNGAVRVNRVLRMDDANGRSTAYDILKDAAPESFISLFSFAPSNANIGFYSEAWDEDSLNLGTNLIQLLEAQGAQSIDLIKQFPRGPYAFAYQKDVNAIGEDLVIDEERRARVLFDLPSVWQRGTFQSDWMGPAESWSNLEWRIKQEPSDSVVVALYGASASKEPILLQDRLEDNPLDLSSIDASTYPYLRLVFDLIDSTERTAPSLEYIRFDYDRAAQVIVYSDQFIADTLQNGQDLQYQFIAENIGDQMSDSLRFNVQIRDRLNNIYDENLDFAAVAPQQETNLSYRFKTDVMADGEANFGFSRLSGQVEQRTIIGARTFFVIGDQIAPLMNVTFDGRRIVNRELISPEPVIRIELTDENRFVLLDDTSAFAVQLIDPLGQARELSTLDADVLFIPASDSDKNQAVLEFTPQFSQDGIYKLVANAQDNNGNQAGALNYEIEFEIITANQLSRLLPYPNPFTTQTRFVYTMTGAEPPSQFLLRILTASGRVVREVSQEEFGPLQVGTHQSEFVWDGTDNFGDPLANGVYLYQVLMKDAQGNDYEQYQNDQTDSYFKNGFGKVVILR